VKGSVLVLGGTGFIGSHLIRRCSEIGFKCVSLSLKRNFIKENLNNVSYLNIDIRDFSELNKALKDIKFDYVINLSGYINHASLFHNGIDTYNTHFQGLLNIISSINLNHVKKFIQIGSSDEYGNTQAPQNERTREDPITPYSLAKLSCTNLLKMLHKTEGLPIVVFRLFLVYGEGQKIDRFLPYIIKSCLRKEKFLTSYGDQIRDFCYVGDIIDGILASFTNQEVNGNIINLASGIPISIRSIIYKVVENVGYGEPQFGKIKYRLQENMRLYADIEKAKKLLNWEPKVNLDEGLEKTINYYKKNLF